MSQPVASVTTLEPAKPTASVVVVHPELAQRWLAKNTHNRRVRARVVGSYARDMAAGHWRLTGESLKFSADGALLDGQHRLLAVIAAEASVPMFVIRGLSTDVQDVMDTGSRRLAGDVLTLSGYENASLLAAAAKWAILFDSNRLYGDFTQNGVSHSEVMKYVDDNATLAEAVSAGGSLRRQIDLQPSLVATCLYLVSRVDAEDAHLFFARLADGIDQPPGSPILALRSRLREVKNNRQRVEPEALMSLVIRTWNAWREGRKLTSIPIYRGGAALRCPDPK